MARPDVRRMCLFVMAVMVALLPLASAAPTQAQSASSDLLYASGSGSLQTVAFTSGGSKVNVCWTVSGQSPSGAFGPSVAFFLKPAGTGPWGPEFDVEQAAQACSTVSLAAGVYVVNVIATPWTQWSLTLTPS
jgi:hypothetical protein